MKLTSLTLSNFRSFTAPQTFHFPEKAGLYFMKGENQTEPRLEANGSGKSTIWDALCWVLFGKTTRGLRAGDVANWDAGKNASVELCYEVLGDQWSLVRTWKPNTWVLRSEHGEVIELADDETNLALHHLGTTLVPFLHSILMAQQQPMFLDLPANLKAQLFTEVMGLDRWIEYSERASKKAAGFSVEVVKHQREAAVLVSQLDALVDSPMGDRVKEWENSRSASISQLEQAFGSKVEEAKVIKRNLAAAEKERKGAPVVASELVRDFDSAVAGNASLMERLTAEYTLPHSHAERDSENIERKIKLANRQKEVCGACGQPLPKEKKQKEIARLEKEFDLMYVELLRLDKVHLNLQVQIKKSKARVSDLSTKVADQSLLVSLAENKVRECKRSLDFTEGALDQIEYDVEKLAGQVNPFIVLEDRRLAGIKFVKAKQALCKKELEAAEASQAIASYWVKGFKDIRLLLIEETLQQLEIEVNSALTELGLVDWELRFEVDKETKSGTIQKGFNVRVLSPHNQQAVPWEAWSGGESQRLRLAATMGLANLIRATTGIVLDVEVWDEPTQYMSGQGVNDLLEALEERAIKENRQIWVVDHRSLGYGGFAGQVTVVKTKTGSIIESRGD